MMNFLHSVYESLVDKSPQHMVMALFLALAGALVVAQLYFFVSRKVADPQVVLTGMMVFALALAAALGIGFERYSREISARNIPASFQQVRRHQHSNIEWQIARRILEVADSDKDGRLSPEEASQAAAKHVREASSFDDTDAANIRALTHLVRYATMPPSIMPHSHPHPHPTLSVGTPAPNWTGDPLRGADHVTN